MEMARMYRLSRKILEDVIKTWETSSTTLEMAKAIDAAKAKLEVLDELESMPAETTPATPVSPGTPLAPIQMPGVPKQDPFVDDLWRKYGDWWRTNAPNIPGVAPWMQPTITCRTSQDVKWPPESSTAKVSSTGWSKRTSGSAE